MVSNSTHSLTNNLVSQNPDGSFYDETRVVEYFKSKGLRWTMQRQLIVEAVCNTRGHFSVDQIYQQISTRFRAVNRATVYRTLELLYELGILVRSINPDNDQFLFELTSNPHHHHLFCKKCSNQLELTEDALAAFKLYVQQQYSFNLELHHFVGTGLCNECSIVA